MATKKTTTNPNGVKKGFLSAREKQTIKEMMHGYSAESIATKLQRDPKQIRSFINEVTGIKEDISLTLVEQLTLRPEWKQFERQFSQEELEEFKHQYVQIMSQMKDQQVMATEELQVFQVITLKIQIDRINAIQKMALDDMHRAHAALDSFADNAYPDDDEKAYIARQEVIYESAKKTNAECASQYKIYSDKQDKMLSALKATREQRVKVLENSKGSILGWLRAAMEEDQRRALGDEAEMMKIASQKEKARLAKPHRFTDGVIDQPLLTPETVVLDFSEEG